MDPLSVVRRRLAAQRLTADPFEHPAEVVAWLGAVQAQVFDEAMWSVGERTRGCAAADVEAAFARGEIVRTHVLRPTWHFVDGPDLRWLLRLTRSRVHGLNRYWYAQHGLDGKTLARAERVVATTLADGARTRPEVAAGLAVDGIEASGPRLAYVLMHCELEEVICSGPRRGKQHTYALVDSRVSPSPLDGLAGERATQELVRRYFESHGPATVKDFTAWSSLLAAETRESLEGLGLEAAVDESGTTWYSGPVRGAPRRGRRGLLIPTFDETIVAYQGLRVVPPYPTLNRGPLERAVVVDGRTLGSWKRTLMAAEVEVEVTPFEPLADRELAAVAGAVQRLGRFIGLPGVLKVRAVAGASRRR